ncbi:MAG TPA: AMP-binding protein [Candidatus Dormibacteraeota bacterium]|nr:AMP-binding protein [Candidatus Dormibacteraeota bacterium]
MATLIRLLDEHADRDAAHAACIVGDERRTYGELAEETRRFAAALVDLGLQPGDRISLYLPNTVDYITCFYGAMRAGMIANPINSVFTSREVRYLLADSAASALVTTPDLLASLTNVLPGLPLHTLITTGVERSDGTLSLTELLSTPGRDLPYPTDDMPACLPYSSGTTGHSKGIVHTHDSLAMQAILSANHLQLRADDVLLQALPLVHLYPGNIIMGGLFTAGATMVVQPRFDPPLFAELLDQVRATACAGVPTTYALLAQLPDETLAPLNFSRLQIAFSAGAPLASQIRIDFKHLYGTRVLDCYGITEAAGNLAANMRYGDAPELSCGVPYPMTEIRITNDDDSEVPVGSIGELTARGPQIMTGYWQRADDSAVTLKGGWLHTGDLARRDERGFLYIVDRKNDMIITGGYNVYPAELEEVLQAHPDVALCAAFAVPDKVKGEKPWAAVVPRKGANLDSDSLDAFCRARLAAYKVPRRFLIVDDLPRSSVGKLLRRELRQRYAAEGDAPLTGEPGIVDRSSTLSTQ